MIAILAIIAIALFFLWLFTLYMARAKIKALEKFSSFLLRPLIKEGFEEIEKEEDGNS